MNQTVMLEIRDRLQAIEDELTAAKRSVADEGLTKLRSKAQTAYLLPPCNLCVAARE